MMHMMDNLDLDNDAIERSEVPANFYPPPRAHRGHPMGPGLPPPHPHVNGTAGGHQRRHRRWWGPLVTTAGEYHQCHLQILTLNIGCSDSMGLALSLLSCDPGWHQFSDNYYRYCGHRIKQWGPASREEAINSEKKRQVKTNKCSVCCVKVELW